MADEAAQIDSTIAVVTPENIAFQYQAAGPFRRLPAFLIDFCIRAGVLFVVGMMLGFSGLIIGALGGALLIVFAFVLEWFYGGLFETYWNGQTPGKRLMGIRVLSIDGQPINGLQAVMRNVLRFADMMPPYPFPFFQYIEGMPPALFFPTFVVGLITSTLNRRFQRLGDVVCGTIVVIEERSWLFGVAKIEDERAGRLAAYVPANYKVSRSMARMLATYVERRRFFSPARRREIARHLGEPLLIKFNLPRDTSHDLLLCALYYRTFIADRDDRDKPIPTSPFASPTGPPASPTPPPSPAIDLVVQPIGARRRR